MSVGIGLEVDRDAVGACGCEELNLLGGSLDHEVDVEGATGAVDVVGDGGCDQGADRDRRDEVAVHDVDVDHARPGVHHFGNLRAKALEVGRQDRGRDPAGAEELSRGGGHTGRSMEWRQCWQTMSSERLRRTIVWCSPQFSHADVIS